MIELFIACLGGLYGYLDGKGKALNHPWYGAVHRNVYLVLIGLLCWIFTSGQYITLSDLWLLPVWFAAAYNLIANPNAFPILGKEWGIKEAAIEWPTTGTTPAINTTGARNLWIIPRYAWIPAALVLVYLMVIWSSIFYARVFPEIGPYLFWDWSVIYGLAFAALLGTIPGLAYYAVFRGGDPKDFVNRFLEANRGFWVFLGAGLL